MVASVRAGSVVVDTYYDNPSSIWNNYPYSFSCILDIIATPNSQEPNFLFDANEFELHILFVPITNHWLKNSYTDS